MPTIIKQCILLSFLLLTGRLALLAQDFSMLKEVQFSSAASCKQYERNALQCAEYILSTPHQPSNPQRTEALQFMIRWMGATPDYHFNLDDRVGRWLNNEETLLGEYMAALTEYCLLHPGPGIDRDSMEVAALHRLAAYCADQSHGIRTNRNIRKLISADQAGKLEPYLRN